MGLLKKQTACLYCYLLLSTCSIKLTPPQRTIKPSAEVITHISMNEGVTVDHCSSSSLMASQSDTTITRVSSRVTPEKKNLKDELDFEQSFSGEKENKNSREILRTSLSGLV